MDKAVLTAYESTKKRAIKGDFIDKLHSQFTVTFLVVILVLIVAKQYEGNYIACWLPTQFSDSQEGYIHQFCWINNTYYYPEVEDPDHFPDNSKYAIHYYQFILFILSGQIMMFFLPSFIWKAIASDSGSYIDKLLELVNKNKVFEKECANHKEKTLPGPSSELNVVTSTLVSTEFAENYRTEFQSYKKRQHSPLGRKDSMRKRQHLVNMEPGDEGTSEEKTLITEKKPTLGKRIKGALIRPISGVENLALYYFLLKVFNLANVLCQIFALRFMFGKNFYKYGWDYLQRVINNEDPLIMSEQFPIVTICDFYTHQNLRQLHMNSAQCLLPINVLIEKFYVFIWFWLYVLAVVTFMNIISWIYEICSSTSIGFIRKYLRIKEKMAHNCNSKRQVDETNLNDKQVKSFLNDYLGKDGLVMMHMTKAVAGDMIFIELLNGLWVEFLRTKAE